MASITASDTGPTANLQGYKRRSGLSGKVYINHLLQGEVVAVDWGTEVEQIPVRIVGSYRTENKPGGETRTGSFRVQDLSDKWALLLWQFLQARKAGDRTNAASIPEFSIITAITDIGAPADSRWQLDGCQIFRFDGGFDQETDLLQRDIPFTFRDEIPLDTFVYTDSGVQTLSGSTGANSVNVASTFFGATPR